MRQDLDAIKKEIEEQLAGGEFVVFHGFSRLMDAVPLVHWDVTRYPDVKMFLDVASRSGVKLLVYHQHEFTPEHIDEALTRLEGVDLPRDEQRAMERRLREMRIYEGFLCALELSFDHGGRVYLFDMRTDWYEELGEILDEIDVNSSDSEDEEEGPLGGGYFSKN